MSAESIKNRLVKTFLRKGHDGLYTRVFENLDQSQRDFLLEVVPLQEGDRPVIGSLQRADKWLLITTQKVVWRSGEETRSIPTSEILQVSADFNSLFQSGGTKLQLKELQIETVNRESHTVEVEEGSPLIGVWNVLKQLGNLNKSAADSSH